LPAEKKYVIKTDVGRIMCEYKNQKGIDPFDRKWDRAEYKRWTRAAQKLLDKLPVNDALDFLMARVKEFERDELDWNLATIASYAWTPRKRRKK